MKQDRLTGKQDTFARAVAAGHSQADAYRVAYGAARMSASTVHVEASKLMANPKVAQRVHVLRMPLEADARYDLAMAMAETGEALALARKNEDARAMVAAVTLRARLNGLMSRDIAVASPLDGLPRELLKAIAASLSSNSPPMLQTLENGP